MKQLLAASLMGFVLCLTLTCNKVSAQSVSAEGFVIPSKSQLAYQNREKTAFIHFGINTFTNREWGTGDEDPSIFNPVNFDANQWARVLKENGFRELILTAKHHDGFCLWPSKYTDHDISKSPWKDGKGDIVKEVAEACRRYGLKFGVYLSPWDMHEPTYGTDAYNEFYMNQLRELLTNYGEISQVWFDGAKGKDAKDMEYDFEAYWNLVRKLQPQAVIFSDEGPDLRWVGNEDGMADSTNWSTIDRSKVSIGKPGQGNYLSHGEPEGSDWVPAECNFSIRPGWFYHPEEDDEVKSLKHLLEIYYKSLGRNCTMLLNIPPTPGGRLHENDVKRLYEFSAALNETFSINLFQDAAIQLGNGSGSRKQNSFNGLTDNNSNTYWFPNGNTTSAILIISTEYPVLADRLVLKEHIRTGQRINSFTIEVKQEEGWIPIGQGTTVGYQRILRFEPIVAKRFRIHLQTRKGRPVLNEIGLYKASEREERAYNRPQGKETNLK